MHIRYPAKTDVWSETELRCLSKALGYHKDVFSKHLNQISNDTGMCSLSRKDIDLMLETKVLHPDLYETFNNHDADYNAKVLRNSLDLLQAKKLSFSELYDARVAYQLYEHKDNAGLVAETAIVLRVLKLCGKVISPLYLKSLMKHMDRFIDDRLLFYEFLTIIPCALDISSLNQADSADCELESSKNSVRSNALYKICDFNTLFMTDDELKTSTLDRSYEESLLHIHVEDANKTDESSMMNEIDECRDTYCTKSYRSKMKVASNAQLKALKSEIEASEEKVLLASAYQHCKCIPHHKDLSRFCHDEKTKPASDCECYDDNIDYSSEVSIASSSEKGPPSCDSQSRSRWHIPAIVSDEDIRLSSSDAIDMEWRIATEVERYKRRKYAKDI